ncbi:MAG TPA: HAD-IC family P-type ATPase, partial [Chitinophagaceae bacterium]|nr:HAD-IC family P-type ATPase [Chitinophagaceae bacterium]
LPGQTLLLHNEELIPADGILTRGRACIDYSFVTGEAAPVVKQVGELVYAGGRQMGENIEVLVVKEVSQSYLTQLWENSEEKTRPTTAFSFVHVLSRYFTWVVLLIAAITAVYWWQHDPSRLWVAVTAIFIIACPCALLLSNTFTNGSVLRILSRNGFYLRNAATIEGIARINRLVFDKTGTLTSPGQTKTSYRGKLLTALQQQQLAALAACSSHPLSKTLAKKLPPPAGLEVHHFTETPGQGIAAVINGITIKLGSHRFVNAQDAMPTGTTVYACFNDEVTGRFSIGNAYRPQVIPLIKKLQKKYRLSILSGDNASEEARLRQLLGAEDILFEQKPEQKLAYIQQLQRKGNRVMMIGDGLNDAGALQQSDIGVALSEDSNNFTPASDAILSARQIALLPAFITLCKANRVIVMASFILSIVYNIAGLYFAVQGNLSPMIAAILMPASSLCIFLVTFGASNWLARRLHL